MDYNTKQVIDQTRNLCNKFINKVDTGRARSKETYKDCQDLLDEIKKLTGEEKCYADNCDGYWNPVTQSKCPKCGNTCPF